MPPIARNGKTHNDQSARADGGSAAHIARVAARLFAAEGFDATPVRKIVEAAGVTKPTLYYYFGSKAGLARALLTDPLNALLAAMRKTLDAERNPVVALESLIELNLAFSRDEPDRARFLYALFFGPLAVGLADEIGRIVESLDSLWSELAERLVAANVIDARRVEGFLAMLRGAICVGTMDFLYCGQDLQDDRAGRVVTDLLHGFGIGPRGRTKPRTNA
jgi:AcrR family transcriptional regulator